MKRRLDRVLEHVAAIVSVPALYAAIAILMWPLATVIVITVLAACAAVVVAGGA